MWRKIGKAFMWLLSALCLAVIVLWLIDYLRQPQMVANILNIKTPPKSLRVIECESPITSDVLTTCSIEISANEFPQLLAGYNFEIIPISTTSHKLGLPKVGPEFEVSIEYSVQPKEFEYGGFVRVITNNEKNHAIIDLYIE